MNLDLIPIVPEDNLFLRRLGETKKETEFAELFRETWQQIPADARAVLKKYFEEGATFETELTGGPSPYIACEIHWFGRAVGSIGCTFRKRGSIHIWAPFVTMMLKHKRDGQYLKTLVAHELAHTYKHALREWEGDYDSVRQNAAYIREELATRALLKGWGFDEDSLDFALALTARSRQYHEKKCEVLSAARREKERDERANLEALKAEALAKYEASEAAE